jgi:ABC-type nitrate/sulfonate/bicarbonate transport system substrate-binding protein
MAFRTFPASIARISARLIVWLTCATALFEPALLAEKPSFTVGWSVYVGWNPYHYLNKSGILRKWADKYGVVIKVQRFDYVPSLDAFVSKNIDACVMTDMETLDMPAAAGVDTTAIIVGDYSNGNDAVLVRHDLTLAQIPGRQVMLVEKTVSQYLFERAMAINGLGDQLRKVRYLNTSDSDIAAAYTSRPGIHHRFRFRGEALIHFRVQLVHHVQLAMPEPKQLDFAVLLDVKANRAEVRELFAVRVFLPIVRIAV